MTDAEKQIKLAGAMGWRKNVPPEAAGWWTHDATKQHRVGPPDPENDANDDYAVLKWARSDTERFSDFKDAMYELGGNMRTKSWVWQYELGDYARAALKVIA